MTQLVYDRSRERPLPRRARPTKTHEEKESVGSYRLLNGHYGIRPTASLGATFPSSFPFALRRRYFFSGRCARTSRFRPHVRIRLAVCGGRYSFRTAGFGGGMPLRMASIPGQPVKTVRFSRLVDPAAHASGAVRFVYAPNRVRKVLTSSVKNLPKAGRGTASGVSR